MLSISNLFKTLKSFSSLNSDINESKLDDALAKAFGEIYEDEYVDDILDELNDELEDRGVEDIYDKWQNDKPLTEEEKARLLAVFKMFP